MTFLIGVHGAAEDVILLSCLQISVGSHRFTYDNVYGSASGDNAVNLYPDCVQPLVDGLFKGYNATVFAYGRLSSSAEDRRRHSSSMCAQEKPSHAHMHYLCRLLP